MRLASSTELIVALIAALTDKADKLHFSFLSPLSFTSDNNNYVNYAKLPVTVVDLACFHDIRSLTLIGNHVKCKRFL